MEQYARATKRLIYEISHDEVLLSSTMTSRYRYRYLDRQSSNIPFERGICVSRDRGGCA